MSSETPARRHPQVANLDEVAGHALPAAPPATTPAAMMKPLAAAVAGHALGCTYYEVPPGGSAFPRHFHCVNEECLFVIEGHATLRLGDREVPVRAGDYVALPAGPASAHQLINTGEHTLRYLCLSTMSPAEVAVFPDAGTVGVVAAASIHDARRGAPWIQLTAPVP